MAAIVNAMAADRTADCARNPDVKTMPQSLVLIANDNIRRRGRSTLSMREDKKRVLRCNAWRGRRNVTDAAITLRQQRLLAAGYIVAAVLAALKRRSRRKAELFKFMSVR
ncbi:hypothetical protein [Bradyrhizobium sp. S69]|uniref:hypothetical protein n=1 Tax=Bradyrhizobium sp. S69 TaxID=1641856 RepID=UPI0015767120|nr:hypothetical protein [Bradyrhizobium sp. S69]